MLLRVIIILTISLNGKVRFSELDNPTNPIRMRLRSMVVKVEHDSADPDNSEGVFVTYSQ